MGAIIDFLTLSWDEIAVFKRRYPCCDIRNLTDSGMHVQQFRLIVQDEELDDDYYRFLLHAGLATASRNFMARITSDEKFKARMKSALPPVKN